MTRYLAFVYAASAMALVPAIAGNANATKPSFYATCASVSCAQGSVCEELPSGPQCVIQSPPSGYYRPPPTPSPSYRQTPPNHYEPNYQNQSCAYGGFYRYGQLICNPAPRWRQPYQNGWTQYGTPPGYYVPPSYRQPVQPQPVRPRPGVPEIIPPTQPIAPVCPMIYAPVCAEKPVVCVTTPCYPVRKTFSNSCMANAESYTVLYQGQCQ